MKNITSILFLALAIVFVADAVQAQTEMTSSEVTFAGHRWKLDQLGDAGTRSFLGRTAMFLERSQLTLLDSEFSDGVIEFDLAAAEASGFVGVKFRDDEKGTGEQFYVRFHQSGRPDATQYLGQLNGVASWQLHAGPNDATAVELGTNQWIPIRILVEGDEADIFVRDMINPALHVDRLRTGRSEGSVKFYALERPNMVTGAYFSEISIRSLRDGEGVRGEARVEPEVPETVLKSWEISPAIDEQSLANSFELEAALTRDVEWKRVGVEENGILNIARYTQITPEAQTVLVRMVIDAESDTVRQFNFGYSDRVRIYVNGQQQFFGNSQWRSRDHRFLGTVGLHDAVILHLDAGVNEVIAAVSESFGGWGFTGQLEDRSGIRISP